MATKLKTSNSEFKKMLGQRIARFRKEQGLSQSNLADCIGVTKNTIYNFESGRILPPVDILYKIALELSVSIDALTMIDSLEGANIIREIPMKEEVFKHYYLGGREWDVNNTKDMVETITPDHKRKVLYDFDENIKDIDPADLYVVVLRRYNEILKAPAGSKVLVQRIVSNKNLSIRHPTYVLVDDTLFFGKPEDEVSAEEIPASYFSRVTPINKANNLTFVGTGALYNKYLFFSPFNGEEHLVDERYLKMKVVGIVNKVIIDY